MYESNNIYMPIYRSFTQVLHDIVNYCSSRWNVVNEDTMSYSLLLYKNLIFFCIIIIVMVYIIRYIHIYTSTYYYTVIYIIIYKYALSIY